MSTLPGSKNDPALPHAVRQPPEPADLQHAHPASPGYPAYGYGSLATLPSGGFEMAHLLDYVKVVHRRRWTFLSAFLVIVIGAVAYTYTRVPIYQSSARLLLQSQRETFGLKDISAFDSMGSGIQTQIAILNSRSVARRAMISLGLLEAPSAPEGEVPTAAATLTPAALRTGEAGQIDAFRGGLVVSQGGAGGLVDVGYRSTNAEQTALFANAVSQAFLDQSRELKSAASREASTWLTDRLGEQRQKVEVSEQALARYRERNNVVSLDERSNPMVQNLGELATAVTKAKTDRISRETTFRRLSGIRNNVDALATFPAVVENAGVQLARNEVLALDRQYAQLADKLGERHPELIRTRESLRAAEARLRDRMIRVVEEVETDVEAARAAEASIIRVFESQKAQAFAANRSGVELAVLIRDLESNRQIYDNLMKQAKEVSLSGDIEANAVRILDEAQIPRAPLWPNTRKNLQYGLLGGLAFALGLVFFFDYLDSRIKSPDEIKKYLGIPFLGLVPVLSAKENGSGGQKATAPPAGFAEAFRNIRTNVIFSSTHSGMQIIAVTSTLPSEGKTVVATNLATSIAEAGQRVLLIDADLRRPRVHQVFGLPQEPGLSNLLIGAAKASDVVRNSRTPALRVITAGRIPPNPAELLGSRRFREFLEMLRETFDWVVLDSPPVLAVTDAPIVAHLSSGVVFVVSAGATARNNARTALEQLYRVRAQVFGAVLNKVDLKRQAYYYSGYYRKDYAKYYTKSKP